MKTLLFVVTLLMCQMSFAGNLVTNPTLTSDNSVSPSAAGVILMTLDNSSSASSGEIALQVKNTGSSGKAALVSTSSSWDAVQGKSTDGIGIYGHSTNFYGAMGESQTESSGYFSSSWSGNTQPTLLIQSIGGTADLFQAQDLSSTSLLRIDSSGQLLAGQGLILNTSGSQPTCDASHRGDLFVKQGGTGVADLLQACLKNSSNAYSWVTK